MSTTNSITFSGFQDLLSFAGAAWLLVALAVVQFIVILLLAFAVKNDAERLLKKEGLFLEAPWLWFFVVLVTGGYLATLAYWLIHYSTFRYHREERG